MLHIEGPDIPTGKLDVWYLEAFCRSGSTDREWKETVIPHKTELLEQDGEGKRLLLLTKVEPDVEVTHEIIAGKDDVEFRVEAVNKGKEFADVLWFQPCMRVASFTGLVQSNYWQKCFIFTKSGLTMLDKTHRNEEARYHGGQVYVPSQINTNDVNPRPISIDKPANGLIGAVSKDGKKLVAMAWSDTQELFQGVIVCVHNDPRIGGLMPLEHKKIRGKIYFLSNSPKTLLKRYETDFFSKR